MSCIHFTGGFERGFGTWPLQGDACRSAVATALEVGYRAIDTAQMYGNERDVGAALKASGVARDEVLVTTKVHPENYGQHAFLPSVRRSLDALGLERVDVLLLHWPPADGAIDRPLLQLAEARARGLAAHIGVSNFTSAMLARAVSLIDDPLVTNQVEFHAGLDQSRLLAGATAAGVPLSAYCAVARGAVARNPLLAEIGEACGRSAVQVALRWILQKGVAVNTMSTRRANMEANFDIMDFTLSHVDMARIDAGTSPQGRIVTTGLVPWAPEWD